MNRPGRIRRFFRVRGLEKGRAAVKLFWVTAAFALACAVLAVITQFFAAELFKWSSSVHREHLELEPNRYLSINSADMKLEVYTHDGDKIIVDYIGETELLIEEDELELKISRVEDFALSLFSRDKFNYILRVGLPAGNIIRFESIKLYSASGDISAERIRAGEFYVTSRSGNISLTSITADVTVNVRSSDVVILQPDWNGIALDFFTNSGVFCSDFFDEPYAAHEGDIHLQRGGEALLFAVHTDTGNLTFNETIIYIE
jgi:hypothetical protein